MIRLISTLRPQCARSVTRLTFKRKGCARNNRDLSHLKGHALLSAVWFWFQWRASCKVFRFWIAEVDSVRGRLQPSVQWTAIKNASTRDLNFPPARSVAIKEKRKLVTFRVVRCWNRSARAVRHPLHRLSVLLSILYLFASHPKVVAINKGW